MAQNTTPSNPNRSQAALKRTLALIAIAVVVVIFAYGWQVTDIDLSVPQETQRQTNVGNALRELLSPNVFTQEYSVVTSTTTFLMNCTDDFAAPAVVAGDAGTITVEPGCASSGDLVRVIGTGVAPSALARLNWIATDGERRIRQVDGTTQDNFTTRDDGTFDVQIEVPRIRGTAGETHTIEIQVRQPVGLPHVSDTTNLVIEKMIETIMLALIATAVSILPSAILSFLAARNLMHPIRIPLGNLLVSFTLFPLGWLIGAALLGQIGMIALNIGRGTGIDLGSAGLLFGFATVAAAGRARLPQQPNNGMATALRSIGTSVLGAVVIVTVLGLVGGIGQNIESRVTRDFLGMIAAFIGSLGELIELSLPLVGGVIGAAVLSSAGTNLSKDAIKVISGAPSHILAAILGGIAGAILLGLAATAGQSAAWAGLLTPIAAAGLASGLLPSFYALISPKPPLTAPMNQRRVHQAVSSVLSVIGAVVMFVAVFLYLRVERGVVEGTLPPQVIAFNLVGINVTVYVVQAMVIGGVLGLLSGAFAGMHAAFPIGSTVYNVTRTVLNSLRSIEPLIMGLVFVIWVGIGPFAGVLALALHSIASLGKLYSEQIESIDLGPVEALQSTGANQLQTIMYAVVPQIIPPYIAFTMYRWDINVRMSTIIGFVGGGGIGFLLSQQLNLLRYRDAGVAVLAIAIVVSILDYASAAIRERYT